MSETPTPSQEPQPGQEGYQSEEVIPAEQVAKVLFDTYGDTLNQPLTMAAMGVDDLESMGDIVKEAVEEAAWYSQAWIKALQQLANNEAVPTVFRNGRTQVHMSRVLPPLPGMTDRQLPRPTDKGLQK